MLMLIMFFLVFFFFTVHSRYLGVFCCDIDQSCRLLHTATHGSHFVYEDVLLGFILVR